MTAKQTYIEYLRVFAHHRYITDSADWIRAHPEEWKKYLAAHLEYRESEEWAEDEPHYHDFKKCREGGEWACK